jgi:putative endonuclease
MYSRHITGRNGEEIAKEFLKNLKYMIIEQNFFCNFGEIDIIAKDKEEYVFVEVKTRKSNKYGSPSEAVTFFKKKHLCKTIEYYIMKNKLEKEFIRIDIIEIYFYDEEKYTINHIKKAL